MESDQSQSDVEHSEVDEEASIADDSDKDVESEEETKDNNFKDEILSPGDTPPDDEHMFEILGNVKIEVKPKVERVLPSWLANPTIISTDLSHTDVDKDFEGLDQLLIDTLKKNRIDGYFPVQRIVIPWLLNSINSSLYRRPSDICVSAPTGSGKTLAYALPVIQALRDRLACKIRALVVLPVKELSKQIYQVFKIYTIGTNLKVGIIGSKNFQEEQKTLFDKYAESSYDILITTPNRLIDHICNTPGFSLKELRFLIIDEADRMMEDMERNWLRFVERAVFGECKWDSCSCEMDNPFQRIGSNVITACSVGNISNPYQKLLFSATLSHDPYKLQKLSLFHPKLFTTVGQVKDGILPKQKGDFTGRYRTPEELKEHIVICDDAIKPLVVWFMLNRFEFKNTLCFTDSTENTDRLCLFLEKMGDIKVGKITSLMKSDVRDSIFKKFRKNEIDIVVCTDRMARGIDFETVDFVFNYDRPRYPETYIHRIGRTARAGKKGTAITMITSKKDLNFFKRLVKSIDKEEIPQLLLPYKEIKELSSRYNEALLEVTKCVQETDKKRTLKQNPYTLKRMKLSKKQLLQAVRQQRQKKKLNKLRK